MSGVPDTLDTSDITEAPMRGNGRKPGAASMWATLRAGPARALVMLIGLYRTMISPLRPPSCRFMPTCSEYAAGALREYGVIRGGGLSALRLAKCGPWHRGGWDPVPERHDQTTGAPEVPDEERESIV